MAGSTPALIDQRKWGSYLLYDTILDIRHHYKITVVEP